MYHENNDKTGKVCIM